MTGLWAWTWWFPYLCGLFIGWGQGWWRWGRKVRNVRKALDEFEGGLRARGFL